MKNKKVALIILDGWGIGKSDNSNAVQVANTPNFDKLWNNNPRNYLSASGLDVGLPEGQMGNSEVGHMNLGAGRIVYQELGRINQSILRGDLLIDPVLQQAFQYARDGSKRVHFIGLLSDGGVHSHIEHLKGLCAAAGAAGLSNDNVFIHGFLDGRDTDPNGGISYLCDLESFLANSCGTVASLIGRYYAMDRDNRWERIKRAYDLLVYGQGTPSQNLVEAVRASYVMGVTDEFVEPIVRVNEFQEPIGKINEGDVVICFNFRTDRGREITTALTQREFPEFGMKPLPLKYITMTCYDETFTGVEVIFHKENIHNTLGEVLASQGKSQVRIAETEKYPHVTYFFNGGREEPMPGEEHILVPSPKVPTYDLMPSMSAPGIADAICDRVTTTTPEPDFICLNFANPDMVGHTGVFSAVVSAVETVDTCLGRVVQTLTDRDYSIIILADHGNAEFMINEDGTPNTAHTTNLVPFLLVNTPYTSIQSGKLGDIAPTILSLMDLPIPVEMTGTNLIS